MSIRSILFSLAAITLLVVLVDPAFANTGVGASIGGGSAAADAGGNLLDTFEGAITGKIGLFIGLAITLVGLWTWIIKQEAGAGIIMIIGGVLITLVPDIFSGMQDVVGGLVDNFSNN